MTPGFRELAAVTRGDEWRGIDAIRIRVNGAPPVVAVESAVMRFALRKGGEVCAELETPAGIVIADADAWEFEVPAVALPLRAGKWYWDFETTDTGGSVKTYLEGTLNVLQDV